MSRKTVFDLSLTLSPVRNVGGLMKRVLFGLSCSVVVILAGLPPASRSQQIVPESPRLKLYVGEVKGDKDLVTSIRSRLVDELAERGVALVASAEEADATLTGIGVHRTYRRWMFRSRPTVLVSIREDVQLNAHDGRKLWTSDVSSTRWAVSETASFAEIAASRVAQRLRQ
jgi:hypothetical protein